MPSQNSPSPERQYVQKFVDALIQWSPLGGSGWAFVHFLLQQDWMLALLTFPAMVVTAVWARYTGNFTARLGEIAGERGTRDANALAGFLDQLDQALRSRLSGFDGRYLKAQASACTAYVGENEVTVPTGILNPDLLEVYVPLKLSPEFLRNFEGDAMPMLPGFGDQPEEMAEQLRKRPTLSIWYFLAQSRTTSQYRRLAILAYGGFGKTTLLRHMTYLYATRPRFVRRRHQSPPLTPFLLYLRKWRDEIAKPDAPNLAALITQHHIPSLPEGKHLQVPDTWAEALLQTGNALVMIDGFDEVAEAQRPAVSQWITAQMQAYPRSRFIVTSRPTAYNEDYRAENVPVPLAVQPFDEDQRNSFVEQWYLCQEQHQRGDRNTPDVRHTASQKAANLIAQLGNRKELRSMAENPLMLNMIAMFHRSYPTEQLPQRPAELYRGICKLQLGDRPLAKRVDLPLPAETCQQVLQGVALAMVEQKQQIISKDALLWQMGQELGRLEERLPAPDLLKSIERVSELMVRKDDGYEFSHRSFQEYLAAAHIKDLQREDWLIQHFEEDYWKGTILLYAAQVNPTHLLKAVYDRYDRSHVAAASLAYDCLQANRRPIEPALVAAINARRYGQLETHLQAGKRREADLETGRLMLQTCGREPGNFLYSSELSEFPCEDLRRLDQLWKNYSGGKWGFSVQKQIWEISGRPMSYNLKDWEEFGDRVGWRKDGRWISYDDYTFDLLLSTPGEFPISHSRPYLGMRLGEISFRDYENVPLFSSLAQRLVNCSTS